MARRSLRSRRAFELLGLFMVGDGALAVAGPSRHARMWVGGPHLWRRAMTFLSDRPTVTRAIGAAELAAGFWIALRQQAAA